MHDFCASVAYNVSDVPSFRLTEEELLRGTIRILKVEDGWLIGHDEGEWGGDLWWYAPDGKRHYKISDDQVRGFSRAASGLFAYAGLTHLGLSYGYIIRIHRDNHKHWKSEKWVDVQSIATPFVKTIFCPI